MSDATHATRRCMMCGEVKPIIGGFYRQKNKRHRCRECHRKCLNEYLRERAEFLKAYKLERGCTDCGYRDHPAALELDHRPGTVKLFEPSELRFKGTWQQMLDELEKCDVVCANCHRVRTHSRPPAMRGHDLRVMPNISTAYRAPDDPGQLGLFAASPVP